MHDVLNPPTDALDRIDAWCLSILGVPAAVLLVGGLVAWWPL